MIPRIPTIFMIYRSIGWQLYVTFSVFQVAKSPAAAATVDRLTDTSKYTGSHKQRFDETGKGKGISGRKDVVDGSGYVTGYQHKDTYNKPN